MPVDFCIRFFVYWVFRDSMLSFSINFASNSCVFFILITLFYKVQICRITLYMVMLVLAYLIFMLVEWICSLFCNFILKFGLQVISCCNLRGKKYIVNLWLIIWQNSMNICPFSSLKWFVIDSIGMFPYFALGHLIVILYFVLVFYLLLPIWPYETLLHLLSVWRCNTNLLCEVFP